MCTFLVTFTQEGRSQMVFTDSSGTYTPPARHDATLTNSGSDEAGRAAYRRVVLRRDAYVGLWLRRAKDFPI